jgi:adenylate kinase family enzyme
VSDGSGPRRIAVIGTTGSGKTMFAQRLAQQLGIPHVELDAVHWGPDWTPVPLQQFRERTAQLLSGRAWTADGNYSKVRDIVWGRADTVVWLDYPLPLILWRLVRRTLRRSLTGEVLWSGNQERLSQALFSGDSILLWAMRTYGRRRREYPALFQQPEYAHLQVVHIRSPGRARAWRQGIGLRRRDPNAGRSAPQRGK